MGASVIHSPGPRVKHMAVGGGYACWSDLSLERRVGAWRAPDEVLRPPVLLTVQSAAEQLNRLRDPHGSLR